MTLKVNPVPFSDLSNVCLLGSCASLAAPLAEFVTSTTVLSAEVTSAEKPDKASMAVYRAVATSAAVSLAEMVTSTGVVNCISGATLPLSTLNQTV